MLVTPIYNPIPPLENNKILTNDGTLLKWTDSPILVTATFSDPVTGVLPIVGTDFATKEYVDLAGFTGRDYFLSKNAADVGSTSYMYPAETGDAAETDTASPTGTAELIFSFITEAGEPGILSMRTGLYELHVHLNTATGDKDVDTYWTLTKVAADGSSSPVVLMTSELSGTLTENSVTSYETHANLAASVTIVATDRLVLKLYANVSGSGAAPTVTISMEGSHDCHLSIQAPSSIWQNQGDELDKINAGTAPTLAGLVLNANPSVISSAYAIQIKPSNDNDDYLQFTAVDNIPVTTVMGGNQYRLMAETPGNISAIFYEDGTHYGSSGWNAGSDTFDLYSTHAMNFIPNSDTSDYIQITTVGDVPTIGTVGSCDLKLAASSGEIQLDDNTTINGTLDCGAIVSTGAVEGTSLTDGTLSAASGSITSAVNGTFSGTVQAEQLTSTDDITAQGTTITLNRGAGGPTIDGVLTFWGTISTGGITYDNSLLKFVFDRTIETSGGVYVGGDVDLDGDLVFDNGGKITNPSANSLQLDERVVGILGDATHAQLNLGGGGVGGATAFVRLLDNGTWVSFMPGAGLTNGVRFFDLSTSGENRPVRIYGYPTGESSQYGQFQITTGPKFSITSDSGEIDFDNENLTTSGDIDAATYTVGGVAGIDFNGAVTNITVVKGIVTAAS